MLSRLPAKVHGEATVTDQSAAYDLRAYPQYFLRSLHAQLNKRSPIPDIMFMHTMPDHDDGLPESLYTPLRAMEGESRTSDVTDRPLLMRRHRTQDLRSRRTASEPERQPNARAMTVRDDYRGDAWCQHPATVHAAAASCAVWYVNMQWLEAREPAHNSGGPPMRQWFIHAGRTPSIAIRTSIASRSPAAFAFAERGSSRMGLCHLLWFLSGRYGAHGPRRWLRSRTCGS